MSSRLVGRVPGDWSRDELPLEEDDDVRDESLVSEEEVELPEEVPELLEVEVAVDDPELEDAELDSVESEAVLAREGIGGKFSCMFVGKLYLLLRIVYG